MGRSIMEWVWRVAIVCALGWIGWELHQIRQTLNEPGDDAATASADYDLHEHVDGIADEVARLNDKVDAIMMAMLRLAR